MQLVGIQLRYVKELLKYLMRRRMVKISQMIVDLFSRELFEAQVAFCRQFGFVENDSEIVGHHSGTTLLVPFGDSVTLCHMNLENFEYVELKTCCPHYMRFIMTNCVTDLALTLENDDISRSWVRISHALQFDTTNSFRQMSQTTTTTTDLNVLNSE